MLSSIIKNITANLKFLYPVKVSFQNEGKIKKIMKNYMFSKRQLFTWTDMKGKFLTQKKQK